MRYSARNHFTHLVIAAAVIAAHALIAAPLYAATPQEKVQPATPATAGSAEAQRGKYLIRIMGCNDCHTPGYAQAGGNVPESAWLTGDALGYKGAWGTTYAANLRLLFASMTRDEWIKYAKSAETRPPMPWFTLRATSDRDLSAMYAYMKALGPAGKPAPAYLPSGQMPAGPAVLFPQ
jgi:mono/diheme cytochrome c family protein